jgi:hypothetical protein
MKNITGYRKAFFIGICIEAIIYILSQLDRLPSNFSTFIIILGYYSLTQENRFNYTVYLILTGINLLFNILIGGLVIIGSTLIVPTEELGMLGWIYFSILIDIAENVFMIVMAYRIRNQIQESNHPEENINLTV